MPCPAMGIDVASPRFGWIVECASTSSIPTAASGSSSPNSKGPNGAGIPVRGTYQQAFQIIVTAADADGAVVWDSGRVESMESRHVVFGSVGRSPQAALSSATAYDWTVSVWVATDVPRQNVALEGRARNVAGKKKLKVQDTGLRTGSAQSQAMSAARFVTGMLNVTHDLSGAHWLVAKSFGQNLCRAPVQVGDVAVERAVLLVAGLGYHIASLNGRRVSDAELESGWTDYERRVPYSVYDVTGLVRGQGAWNVLGVALGNGWYATWGGGEPSRVRKTFIAKLFVNGKEVLASTAATRAEKKSLGEGDGTAVSSERGADDALWVCGEGPVVYDSLYNGEVFDARRASRVQGWDTPEFKIDSHWDFAMIAPAPPPGKLVSPKMPPVRRVAELPALSLSEPAPGVFVVDFGQNIAGRVAISLPRTGTGNVTLRHAEVLQHTGITAHPVPGMISTDNLRSARATDVYMYGEGQGSDGRSGREEGDVVVYEPTFTYHGFRYLEVRGYEPRLSDVKAVVLQSDAAPTGNIEFSDPLLSQLQAAIFWGQRGNLMSVPTDCPQRDERKGWLGDAQLSGEEVLFNFDVVATLIKFVRDICDTQNEVGQIADTAPFTFGGRPADPSWGSALPSLVFYLFKATGDPLVLQEFYPYLVKYVDSLLVAAEIAGLANLYKSYGDWCALPGVPMCSPHLTGSFSFLENVRQMAEMAAALGQTQDEKIYLTYHQSFTRAFHGAFYRNGTYDNGVQTCLALPLWAGAVPPDLQESIADKLVRDLVETHRYHATTGIIGMKYMLEVLSRMGKTDVAARMLQQRDYPSFGYMLTNPHEPATTIWELWNGDQAGPEMNSRNHVMFGGSVGGWLYKFLGGVRAGPASLAAAGFREVEFAPPLGTCMPLTKVSTSLQTLQGRVRMDWELGPCEEASPPLSSKELRPSTNSSSSSCRRLLTSILIPLGSRGHVILDGRTLAPPSPAFTVHIDGVDVLEASLEPWGLEVLQATESLVELSLTSGTWMIETLFEVNAEAASHCNTDAAFNVSPRGGGGGYSGGMQDATGAEGVTATS